MVEVHANGGTKAAWVVFNVYAASNPEIAALLDDDHGDIPDDLFEETDLTPFLEDLKRVGNTEKALKKWALKNIDALSQLSRPDLIALSDALIERGLRPAWVSRELRPAVNEKRRAQLAAYIWTDYVDEAGKLGYRFKLNELDDALEVNGKRISDRIQARILVHLNEVGMKNTELARLSFLAEAGEHSYHPVKEYLKDQKWDGGDHIAALAAHFVDAHNPITYADGTTKSVIHAWLYRWLIGAVAKVYNPSLAQNAMIVLDGVQGKGKSYFAKWLCPLPGLHFEGAIHPEDKDYLRYLSTRWIWEVNELGVTMRSADRDALKAFTTLQEVTYRPAYGKYPLHKPALASFIGTVNFEGALLNDPTGHRRFWPVEIVSLDWGYTKTIDVNQLWAQAYQLHEKKESWKLCPEEKVVHATICGVYEVEDILESSLREWFKVEPGNQNLYLHTTDIIHHLRTYSDIGWRDRALEMRLASSLKKLGLVKARRNYRGGYEGIAKIIPPPMNGGAW